MAHKRSASGQVEDSIYDVAELILSCLSNIGKEFIKCAGYAKCYFKHAWTELSVHGKMKK